MCRAILVMLVFPALTQAQQATSAIMASRNNPDLRSGNRTVGKLNDLECVVDRYQGDWAWVRDSSGDSGWVRRTDVVPLNEAVDYFTQMIRREPAEPEWYNRRAVVRQINGDFDAALADISDAIRLASQSPSYYNTRGNVYAAKGDFNRALADYNAALRLDPNSAAAWANAGAARYQQGDFQKALQDYDRAIRIEPNDALLHSRRAWILATAADDRFRDGKKAVESALRACELTNWRQWADIDTLAAAYAEASDFDSAVKYAKQALDLAPETDPQRKEAAAHLSLFKDKQPVRERAAVAD